MNIFSRQISCISILFGLVVLMGWADIAKGATYSIISDNSYGNVKRSIDVMLEKKVSKEVIRTIALKLKNTERKEYERIFIVYYLPDMEVDSGAWATSHFNPSLEVKILGLTVAEEEKMTREATESMAHVMAEEEVRKRLKTPRSASQ